MIRITKVTTSQGDDGLTLGPGFNYIDKSSSDIEFFGSLDELNASLGEAYLYVKNQKIKKIIEKIQHQLFNLGAKFYKQLDIDKNMIEFLENEITRFNANLPVLDSFLLANGTIEVIKLHISRTLARKAERRFWATKSNTKNIGIYLNRLSDLIFVFLRRKSKKKWIPSEGEIFNNG